MSQAPAATSGARDTARKRDLPLAAARTASFTATKGTWISLDVSPDGQTIVFDLLGDLYTMPIAGGRATRLTSGMAYDVQPRFSPDGKRVVFVSDRSGGDNVWIISLDRKDTVQVTKGNNNLYVSPEWTPDGKYIVASRSGALFGAAKLWLFHVDGGTGQALTPVGPTPQQLAQVKMLGAAFGKDPRYIWYATRQGDWSYNAILPQYQLAVYDRETGTQTAMSARLGSGFRPALSPDGRWLAYGSRHKTETGLRIRNVESGEERWLVAPVQRDDQESRASLDVLPGYSFTPDSRAVVISYGGEVWRVPVEGGNPARIPLTVDVNVEVGPEVRFASKIDDARTFTAKQIRDVAPSPDGTKLAFTALNRVYVLDLPSAAQGAAAAAAAATTAPTTLTGARRVSNLEVNEHFPVWSPDGRSIAFVTWSDREGGHIYRAPADGRGVRPQQLTRIAAYYTHPAWSPDGRRIVAVRAAARDMQEAFGGFTPMLGAQFVYLPATGGDVVAIAPTAGRRWPHFVATDTNRIYAYGFQDGLVSMRWDGTDVKPILKVTGPMPPTEPGPQPPQPPPAAIVKMSPRGERALALVGTDIYVVTVPFVGGQTPTVSVATPDNAAFPVRKLTDVAGQFPAWGYDGNTVHWGIGNAYALYDLERARQVEDSMRQAQRSAPRDTAAPRPAPQRDTTQQRTDSTRSPLPKPDSLIPIAKPAGQDTTKRGYKPLERRVVVTVTRDVPRASAVLRGARVITMRGREVIENADVVVRDNRIVAVGARGSVQVPGDAQVIDVPGKTIVPGFVDTHYHPQWLAPEIHSSQVWQYLATLAYGTTTTRDPQTSSTDVLAYADRVETGDVLGPRAYHTGPGVFLMELIRDAEHAKTVLRRYAQYYDVKTLKMYMTGNRQQRQWVIMAAKELGLMPTTEGGLDFKLNMTHAIDGYSGLEHSLPIAPVYDDVVQLFVKSGITYSPTLLVSYGGPFGENYFYTTENSYTDPKLRRFIPEIELDARFRRRGTNAAGSPGPGGWFMKDEYVYPKHAEFAKRLLDAGGRVGVGSHGQLQGLGYHWEMWATASGGMSNHDVLRAATILGAEAIGFGGDVGSVEAGKLADLVVLDANPLENIRNTNTIRYVMKNGRLYDGNTLNEVYPSKKTLPAFAWQHMGPGVSGSNER